jgi:hypothetical protein
LFSAANAQQQPATAPAPAAPKPALTPEKQYADPIFNFVFNYTYMAPGGDLAERFGNIHNAGAGVQFKTQRNWLFGAEASYQFGTDVKESNMLYNLTNSNGNVMNGSGSPGDYSVGQRGFSMFGKAGKLFPVSWRNLNSGIVIMAGAGVYYHKVNISTTRNDIPMLTEEYKKGYDRLSMGPALTQFIGYSYQSHSRFYNFYIGFDCMQAFTKSVRQYNFDTMQPDTKERLDLTFGARIGWMIPIYMQASSRDDEYEFR